MYGWMKRSLKYRGPSMIGDPRNTQKILYVGNMGGETSTMKKPNGQTCLSIGDSSH